ncbi:MAG TPA: hypothetical protein VGL94_18555 [Ktedonobacteraceae bacterium]
MANRSYTPNPDDSTVQDLKVIPKASLQANHVGQQQVESRTEYVEDKNLRRAGQRYWITKLAYFVVGVLEVILLMRFAFRLMGANQESIFVMFLYNLSHVFVYPFSGIFDDPVLGSSSVFEVSTLIAMLVYALIAWGLAALGRVIFAPPLTNDQRVIISRSSRNTP